MRKAEMKSLLKTLYVLREQLSLLTPTPSRMDTRQAWEALCPNNEADRECLSRIATAAQDAIDTVLDMA